MDQYCVAMSRGNVIQGVPVRMRGESGLDFFELAKIYGFRQEQAELKTSSSDKRSSTHQMPIDLSWRVLYLYTHPSALPPKSQRTGLETRKEHGIIPDRAGLPFFRSPNIKRQRDRGQENQF